MSCKSYSDNCGEPVSWNEKCSYIPASTLLSNPSLVRDMSLADLQSSGMSFSELQGFCRSIRESYSSSPCPLYQQDCDSSYHIACNSYAGPHFLEPQLPSSSFQVPSCFETTSSEDNEVWCDTPHAGDDTDELGCAEWFNCEMMGLDVDKNNPHSRFDWPVPMEPVFSPSLLPLLEFGPKRELFHVDDEGYVQVYTMGECRKFLVEKGSIGVWFGPDHPKNISERVHNGRKSKEAAMFRAVIEAIRAAGNAGVKKLQINTDYLNVIRFMLYFIWKWENNKWMTVKGTSVVNRVLIEELDYFSKLIEIKWNYVPTEDQAEGILEADKLAQTVLDDLEDLGNTSESTTPTLTEPKSLVASPKIAPKHAPIRFNPY